MPKPHVPALLLAVAGLVPLAALTSFGGDLDVFLLVLGLLHSAPFWIGAVILLARRSTPSAIAVGCLAIVAEAALIAWAGAQLDEDAQAALIFVFFTPLAGAALAALATAAAFIASRRRTPAA